MSVPPNTRTPSEPGEALAALSRSAVYVALALGFAPPEDGEVAERLGSPEGGESLAEALGAAGTAELSAVARRLAARRPASDTHRRLFGHTARGAVPPYAAEYGSDTIFQQPQRLADIAGFYAAFGMGIDPQRHERADHVRCQLEFLAFLARKAAYALEHGEEDCTEEIEKADRLFLGEHLGRVAPALGERLRQEDPEGFYGVLGVLLRGFVEAECRRCGVASGPEHLELRIDDGDRVPAACGSCPEAAGA